MFKRLIASALFAGLSAGALAALLHLTFVVPLILEGELYENGIVTHFAAPPEGQDHEHATEDSATAAEEEDAHAVEPAASADAVDAALAFDLRRNLGTFGFSLITYTGFALFMVAGFALAERAGHTVSARKGMIWGLAGFLAMELAPAFGLPPELPGGSSAPLELRQVWWVGCVLATGAGIALLAFGRNALAIGTAIVLIALPHLIGTPTAAFGGVAPPELAAHFASRVLGAGAVCWALLGTIAGAVWSWDQSA